jgi:hypothetical protein
MTELAVRFGEGWRGTYATGTLGSLRTSETGMLGSLMKGPLSLVADKCWRSSAIINGDAMLRRSRRPVLDWLPWFFEGDLPRIPVVEGDCERKMGDMPRRGLSTGLETSGECDRGRPCAASLAYSCTTRCRAFAVLMLLAVIIFSSPRERETGRQREREERERE